MKEIPMIVLPQDESRRRALEAKLEEYRRRQEERRNQDTFIHPKLFNMTYSHGLYKLEILERLLRDGELDTARFSLELNKRYDFLDADSYRSALSAIDDYCRTGGVHTKGGTGLHAPV